MSCLQWGLLMLAAPAILVAQSSVAADDFNDRGLAASARRDFSVAESLLRESLRLWQDMGPPYEGHAATVMVNLAEAICGQGRWKDGARILSAALEMSRRSLGAEHIRTLSNMNFLSSTLLILGELDQALALYSEALDIERKRYPGTAELAQTLMGISSYYVRTNRTAEALAPAEEALKVSIQASGENSTDTAMAYANVGQIHVFSHQTARAIPLFHKAEAIYAAVLSPEDPRYASVLSQEGLALAEDHKLVSADRNMTRAVEILSHCPGCQYLSAVAQSNLGWLRYQEGKYSDADALLTHALALEESYAARLSSEMAATLDRLAAVRRKEHRNTEAEQLHNRALTLQSYR